MSVRLCKVIIPLDRLCAEVFEMGDFVVTDPTTKTPSTHSLNNEVTAQDGAYSRRSVNVQSTH